MSRVYFHLCPIYVVLDIIPNGTQSTKYTQSVKFDLWEWCNIPTQNRNGNFCVSFDALKHIWQDASFCSI